MPRTTHKPTTVIGYSVDDEILCRECLTATTPLTGERLSHTCDRRLYGAEFEHDLRTGHPVLRFHNEISDKLTAAITREGWMAVPGRPGLFFTRRHSQKPPHFVTIDEGASTCPACEASGRLEAPAQVLPLYFGDMANNEEERCTHCDRPLLEILEAAENARPIEVTKERFGAARLPALHFTAKPPPVVVEELQRAGWIFHRSARRWVWYRGAPVTVPAILNLPAPQGPRAPVTARPPIIHKGAALARLGTAEA